MGNLHFSGNDLNKPQIYAGEQDLIHSAGLRHLVLSHEKINEWSIIIDNYLVTSKPYWNINFSTVKVSTDLKINRTYLSLVINCTKHTRFENYINSLRIADFQALILSELVNFKPKYTLEYYYHKVGFISRSAFNKAFKQNTGLTPSQFLTQLPLEF